MCVFWCEITIHNVDEWVTEWILSSIPLFCFYGSQLCCSNGKQQTSWKWPVSIIERVVGDQISKETDCWPTCSLAWKTRYHMNADVALWLPDVHKQDSFFFFFSFTEWSFEVMAVAKMINSCSELFNISVTLHIFYIYWGNAYSYHNKGSFVGWL